jgi:regulator of protease activity HflC (stomatin/prohibitin superfamily)
MRAVSILSAAALAAALGSTGCSFATVEPGHRGLMFTPNDGGLKREVLQPGKYQLGWCFMYCTPNRVDDFDVTYSTKFEQIETKSQEGLDLHLKLSVIYRPIVSELYQLDTEIGPNYYDEVVGPEFKSACRGVFARHSYMELQKRNEAIENEVEAEVRRRTAGKHVEISSITLESVDYAPEIAQAERARVASEREAARRKQQIENEAEQKKLALEKDAEQKKLVLEAETEQRKLELQAATEQKRMELDASSTQKKLELQTEADEAKVRNALQLARIETEKKVVKEQAEIDRMRATTEAEQKIIAARAEGEALKAVAKAHAEEAKATSAGITPMEVMVHAYDALAHLGGTGTTIMLGDWAKMPNFLFPRVPSFNSAFTLPYAPYVAPPSAPAPTTLLPKGGGNVLSSTSKGGDNPY